jgi:putative transferase (TIGR04331 family)
MTQYCTLVVSDEAEKWPSDEKLVLIDGWCAFNNKLFLLKDNLEIDFSCLLHKEDKYSKDQRHSIARAVESRILKKIIIILNDYHEVNYSERCWKILLGHWLRRYVEVVYNRHLNIQNAFSKFNINKVVLSRHSSSDLISKNSRDANTFFSDPYWNSCLYTKIIYQCFNFKNVRYSFIEYSKNIILNKRVKKPIRRLFSFTYRHLSSLGIYFRRNADPFYINTYLSKWFEIKIFLLNKVFPVAWRSPELQSSTFIDFKTRQDLAKKISEGEISTDIDSFIFGSIFEFIPKLYVEDFRAILKKNSKL